jgi:hypothetical protein
MLMVPAPVLRALAWWLFWHLPVAQPYDPPLPEWWAGGRVLTRDWVHVGVRPAADLGSAGIGLTLQVSTYLL